MSYADPGNWAQSDPHDFEAQLTQRIDAMETRRTSDTNHRRFVAAECARLASFFGVPEVEVAAAFTEDDLYALV